MEIGHREQGPNMSQCQRAVSDASDSVSGESVATLIVGSPRGTGAVFAASYNPSPECSIPTWPGLSMGVNSQVTMSKV